LLEDRSSASSFSWALHYLGLELSILLLLPKEKHVKSRFEGRESNIAIATGTISRLLVFDIEGDMAKSHVSDVIQNRIRQDTRDAIVDTVYG
jgi:hypothetical protein